MNRDEVFRYIKEKHDAEPHYPWERYPNYAVFKHDGTTKWFAAVIDITMDKLGVNSKQLVDVILLKCDPILRDSLVDNEGIFPGYHMNKDNWVSVLLDGPVDEFELSGLIDWSFNLTKPKTKKKK